MVGSGSGIIGPHLFINPSLFPSYHSLYIIEILLYTVFICFSLDVGRILFSGNRKILYSECSNAKYSLFIFLFKPLISIHYSAFTPQNDFFTSTEHMSTTLSTGNVVAMNSCFGLVRPREYVRADNTEVAVLL